MITHYDAVLAMMAAVGMCKTLRCDPQKLLDTILDDGPASEKLELIAVEWQERMQAPGLIESTE